MSEVNYEEKTIISLKVNVEGCLELAIGDEDEPFESVGMQPPDELVEIIRQILRDALKTEHEEEFRKTIKLALDRLEKAEERPWCYD